MSLNAASSSSLPAQPQGKRRPPRLCTSGGRGWAPNTLTSLSDRSHPLGAPALLWVGAKEREWQFGPTRADSAPELEETPGASLAEQALVGAKRSERVNAVEAPHWVKPGPPCASLRLGLHSADRSRPHRQAPFAQSQTPERKKNTRACPPKGPRTEGHLAKQRR